MLAGAPGEAAREARERNGSAEARTSRAALRRAAADKRGELAPLKRRIGELDTMIAKLTKKIGEIDAALADTALYDRDPGRVATLGKERAEAASALAAAEDHWLALSAEYENALSTLYHSHA